ncbi:MAG: hypothetical protein LBU25_01910 [Treponema sp.]|nr:hypothetical protein [Treponema sp.]
MSTILDLRETAPNHWQAKYEGNYGVYTVKIRTDGKRRMSSSCSCPSAYDPCKHIPIVEEAIAERIAKNAGNRQGTKLRVEELLKNCTHEELYTFIVRMAKNNPDLTNAVFLEFAEKIEDEGGNKYVAIIRRGLENIVLGEDGYYDEKGIDLDVLDEWAEKAEQFLHKEKPREAVLIAQAYIEAFVRWLQETVEGDFIDRIPETYWSYPFKILEKAAADPKVEVKALYEYGMAEVAKKKYADLGMEDHFNDLLMILSVRVNPHAFIALQRQLLDRVTDKSSYEAEKILRRIIHCYTQCQEPEKAWNYVEAHIQIARFRRMAVEKRIEEKRFTDAKKLIHDYIATKQHTDRSDIWDEYLLRIAQEERDIPAIRSIAYGFIRQTFNARYYGIYKSAFSAGEWEEAFERLFGHYTSLKSPWHDAAADLLAAEGKAERLLEQVGKHPALEKLEKYHRFFAGLFPEKTLALFRRALDRYAAENTGRTHYEHILTVFEKMQKIPGGDVLVGDMKAHYRVTYKNRRAMVEILNRK